MQWGLVSGKLDQTATGSAANYDLGFHHSVVVKGIAPFTKVYYTCGDAAGGVSAQFSTTTSRAAGDTTPFTVSIVGDMGTTNGQASTAGLIASQASAEFTWHIGDISYADDGVETLYEATWNDYMNRVQPFAANQAYMTLPGNHEATCSEKLPFECSNAHRNFTAYLTRFRMPWPESGGVNNMWYSFDHGMVHFVSISTETDFPGAAEGPGTHLNAGPFGNQVAWLISDLKRAAANRANVPWIVVSGHRPLYSGGHSEAPVIAFLEPIFLQFDVDLYFAGHVHWYERLWPVINGTLVQKDYVNPRSPVYIVNGAGGNVEGPTKHSEAPDWQAFLNKKSFGFGQLTFESATKASWKFFRADDSMALDDQFTMVKKR